MKVKDMISMLQKHNPDEEVIVRFAVDPLDRIGYTLGTIDIDKYYNDCAIYAVYHDRKEDCEFIGQVYLPEAYEKSKNKDKYRKEENE